MYNSLAKEVKEIMNWLDWDAGEYRFSRATMDSKPYQIVREDEKTTIIFNALGINKEDIKIDITREHGKDYLCLSGNTKNPVLNRDYSVDGRFALDGETVRDIEWETVDGLLMVVINFKKPEKSKIKITAK